MGIFGTKVTAETVAKPTFAEQMAAIKSAFKTAHENANNLHSMMEEEIKSKEAQIATLQSDIETINVTKKEVYENASKLQIDKLNEEIKYLNDRIAELKKSRNEKIAELEAQIDEVEAKLSDLGAKKKGWSNRMFK